MEIGIEEGNEIEKIGEIIIEIYEDVVPKTSRNFITLCKNERGKSYKNTIFHRIIPGFMIQGGDYEFGDGRGGESIYGRYYEDENFKLKHDDIGILSCANSGPNTNGSQFFITLDKQPHLDGKHVVFGKMIKGYEIIKRIERYGTEEGRPKKRIKIIASEIYEKKRKN